MASRHTDVKTMCRCCWASREPSFPFSNAVSAEMAAFLEVAHLMLIHEIIDGSLWENKEIGEQSCWVLAVFGNLLPCRARLRPINGGDWEVGSRCDDDL